MTTMREVVINTVAIFEWEKERATSTNEERKEYYGMLFDAMRSVTPTDGDIVNATKHLGDELKLKGWKPASIKVRRSEFRRIVENIEHVDSETKSWKSALRDIRNSTLPESIRMLDDMQSTMDAIEALQTKLADQYSDWQMLDVTCDAIVYSDDNEAELLKVA